MNHSMFEFVTFHLREDVSQEEYLVSFAKVYEKFLKNHSEIRQFFHLYDPSTQMYANFVEWTSREMAQQVEKEMFALPEGQEWFGFMHDASISMRHFHSLCREDGNLSLKIGGIELSSFHIASHTTQEKLLASAQSMVQGLYVGKNGFFAHEILIDEQGNYLDVLYADSREKSSELCSSWFTPTGGIVPFAQGYMENIETGSANIQFFEVIL